MDIPVHPKVRSVDCFPAEVSGRRMICLRDPLSYSDRTLVVTEPTFYVISLLDGHHSFLDIQAAYMRHYGDLLFQEKIGEIVTQLDDHLFLENERFLQHRAAAEAKFMANPLREPFLAGKSYESEPSKLRAQISSFFESPEGPGKLRREGSTEGTLSGAIVPHIDYARGGFCYAWAYQEIRECSDADIFVILGTLHTEASTPFIATRKGFSTPLGDVETDQEFVVALAEECSFDLFAEEAAHRAEHSLELQVVFLRYIFGQERSIKIVPILCASFHEFADTGLSPLQDSRISSFLTSLKKEVSFRKERVCILASADLAHMGPRFGDRTPLGESDWRSLAHEDRQTIEKIEKMDVDAFFQEMHRENHRRKICGVSAIYALLTAVTASRGKLLKYGRWPDPQGTVTYASVGFYR